MSKSPLANLRPRFTKEDCDLFARYPRKVAWDQVVEPDQRLFRDLRGRLKELSAAAKGHADMDQSSVHFKPFVSHPSPNGRSPAEIWTCLFPSVVPNKSFALQVAFIISKRGAELCLCLGAGWSQARNEEPENAKWFAHLKRRLGELASGTLPFPLSERDILKDWKLRTRWLLEAGQSDFGSLAAWAAHAAGPDGNGAGICRYFTPQDIEAIGTGIADVFRQAVVTFLPLFETIYGGANQSVLHGVRNAKVAVPEPRLDRELGTPVTEEDLSRGMFIDPATFHRIVRALRRKKNIVLQGPPGVGKSFVARRVAYAALGHHDPTRVEAVQFHPSYAYEDFIRGWRPDGKGSFRLQDGPFVSFCETARSYPELPFVFVIDEINRGNLAKIFGELMLLIEPDKRGPEFAVPLMYRRDREARFYVPPKLHLIGLMNTADRSLALVDYALRRRFVFFDLAPQFGVPFQQHLIARGASADFAAHVAGRMLELNQEIADDKELGRGFQIGHSYFCPNEEDVDRFDWDEWLSDVVELEVLPLLREYWFDDPDRAEAWGPKLCH
jgi:hypothetical protein